MHSAGTRGTGCHGSAEAQGMCGYAGRPRFTAHHFPILFFGKPAHLSSGPARIAVKTQAPLVPTFLLRQPDDTFLLRLYPPIVPEPWTTVAELQERIRDVLEQEIGRNPLQWFMFNDFWNP